MGHDVNIHYVQQSISVSSLQEILRNVTVLRPTTKELKTMTDTEISFDPSTNPPRRTEQPIRDVKADPHQMPKIIDRHETAADVQRRGHLMPEEWDVRFDRNNQPTNHPDRQSTSE
jgi:hypothetical protein